MANDPITDPLLSILIPTMPCRKEYLDRLMLVLEPQAAGKSVEILLERDAGDHDGGLQIGQKRNALVARSRGLFVAFVDDDDLVSVDYVDRILSAIINNPGIDCIGIEGQMTVDGQAGFAKPFYHSIANKAWREEKGVYYRPPNHLNPIRRELVAQVSFLPVSFGEDRDFSARIYPLLRREIVLQGTLYYYLYRRERPEKKK